MLQRILEERLLPIFTSDRKLAQALGVNQSSISRLRTSGSVGVLLANRIARLLGERDANALIQKVEPDPENLTRQIVCLGHLDGFSSALEHARVLHPEMDESIWSAVATARWHPMPQVATVNLLTLAAQAVLYGRQTRESGTIRVARRDAPEDASPDSATVQQAGTAARRSRARNSTQQQPGRRARRTAPKIPKSR